MNFKMSFKMNFSSGSNISNMTSSWSTDHKLASVSRLSFGKELATHLPINLGLILFVFIQLEKLI